MTKRSRRLKTWGLILVGLAAAALPVAGYVRWRWERREHETKRRVLAAERHQCLSLMRKLEETAAIDVTDEPLSAVLQRLTDQHGIPFQMEEMEFDWVAATRDLPVTLDLPPIRLRCLLYWLLDPVGLQFYLHDDKVVIFNSTQPGRTAEAICVGAIYPVPPRLFSEEPASHGRMEAVFALGGAPEKEEKRSRSGMGGMGVVSGGGIGGLGGGAIPAGVPANALASAMSGGPLLALPGGLAVAATPYGHERVERLLAALDGWDERRDTRQPVRLTLPDESALRLTEKLAQTTDLEFEETPLRDVRRVIQRRYGIGLMWDAAALTIRAVDDQHPVTIHSRNRPLGEGLEKLLASCGLDYCPREDVLWITTPFAADVQTEVWLHPVGDLVGVAGGRLSQRALKRLTHHLQPGELTTPIEVGGEPCAVIRGTERDQAWAADALHALRLRPLPASEPREPASDDSEWQVASYDVRALVDPDFGIVDEAELAAFVQQTLTHTRQWNAATKQGTVQIAPLRPFISRGALILTHPAANRERIRDLVACLATHSDELRSLFRSRRGDGPVSDERLLAYVHGTGPEWARALAAFHLLRQRPVPPKTRAALQALCRTPAADGAAPLFSVLSTSQTPEQSP